MCIRDSLNADPRKNVSRNRFVISSILSTCVPRNRFAVSPILSTSGLRNRFASIRKLAAMIWNGYRDQASTMLHSSTVTNSIEQNTAPQIGWRTEKGGKRRTRHRKGRQASSRCRYPPIWRRISRQFVRRTRWWSCWKKENKKETRWIYLPWLDDETEDDEDSVELWRERFLFLLRLRRLMDLDSSCNAIFSNWRDFLDFPIIKLAKQGIFISKPNWKEERLFCGRTPNTRMRRVNFETRK